MQIQSKQIRQNENDQTVYFTLTDDQDNFYDFHADIPKDVDVQKHLEANMRRYLRLIRKREYPDNPLETFDTLETFEQWIADGCNVPEVSDDEGNIIRPAFVAKKVPWRGTHPPKERIIDGEKISKETIRQFKCATSTKELKQVMKRVLLGSTL